MSFRTVNILLAVACIALASFVLLGSLGFEYQRAAEFPIVLSVFLCVVAIILLAGDLSRVGRTRERSYPFADTPWMRLLASMVALVLLALGAGWIGFYESAFLFLLAMTTLMARGEGRPWRTLATSLVFSFCGTVAVYVAFDIILRVPTPPGVILG